MKIGGNTVGNLMPRTNWEQKDPNKADYLKGRDALEMLIQKTGEDAKDVANQAKTAADNAQTAADNAQTAADDAKTAADDAKTAAENALKESKEYADNKVKLINVVLTVNDWVGDVAPYKQTIGIEGILSTDRPHYGPVYSENTETSMAEKDAWSLVDDLDTADGSVTFTCFEDKPQTSVAVQMEVHR